MATKEFIGKINEIRRQKQLCPISWNTAVKFLMARKFDVERAIHLYEQHELTRQREGLYKLNPAIDPLRTELSTGKFTILPCRDSSGAAIAIFTAHLHNPLYTSHQTTLQGVVYQLDAALQSAETQRCGLIFVYDMTESIYQNFDYGLSQKILTLLKGGYPARLKKVLIVTAPLWFRAPFRVLRLFVREKLRDRVYTVTLPELVNHIPPQCLSKKLGGSLEINHDAWLMRCFESLTLKAESGNHIDDMDAKTEDSSIFENVPTIDNDYPILFLGDEMSELSDEDDKTDIAEESLSDTEETVSDTDHQLQQRGVPIELSAAEEEEKDSVKESHIKSMTHVINVSKSSHPNDVQNGQGSPTILPNSGNGDLNNEDSLHSSDGDSQTLEEFLSYVKEMGRHGLYLEYNEIRSKMPDGTFDASRMRPNQMKNRYMDVLAFDQSRVVLCKDDSESNADYINANYVDGYKQKNAFISTQGPLPCTFGDFWRMVWEQQSCVVVMTTKTVERGRTKCGVYWPIDKGSSVTHSTFSITNTETKSDDHFILTLLSVLDSRTGAERQIEHLQFTSWPDYGVPDSALAMLSFLSTVRETQARLTSVMGDSWTGHPLGPPIIVHCSAGIGRTGTLCTLDICLKRLENVGTIDVKGTVQKIRSQRAYSIQMPDQYVFCHLAILEYALKTDKLSEVDLTDFEDEDDRS